MAKKLSIGSWAYTFGPYEDDPIRLMLLSRNWHDLSLMVLRLGRLSHILTLTIIR